VAVVAAGGADGGSTAAECKVRVNSPGSGAAGTGVAVEAGVAAVRNIRVNSPGSDSTGAGVCDATGGSGTERNMRVNSPGCGAAGGAGAVWSGLGATIWAVGISSCVGGRGNGSGSEAGAALLGGASISAGIFHTPLCAEVLPGVGEGASALAAATSQSRNFKVPGNSSVTT
jgi:hypothetical protein